MAVSLIKAIINRTKLLHSGLNQYISIARKQVHKCNNPMIRPQQVVNLSTAE